MPPQWRQTEASYADIASQNPPQNSKKIRKKVMKESYEIKESYADTASQNPPPLKTQKREERKLKHSINCFKPFDT